MSTEPQGPKQPEFDPPMSVFSGPIAELVGHQMLNPPSRPGLLAVLDRFEILKIIGSGGMGIVLLARDGETGGEVAIKLIRPELAANDEVTHRFLKEAGHMQKLKHKCIVPVLELPSAARCPYLVMPFFENGNLAKAIRPGKPLESDRILEIALQIAEGLQFAHQSGIIHRDLKPANILMGPGGRACLSDFGLARTVFNDTIVDVENQQVEGTAPYISPAVAMGHAEDTRCDIYAFGALLYEMLTGEPPYKGHSTREVRAMVLEGPPPSIKSLNPRANPGLVLIAEAAMERKLRDRYANMADIVSDLQLVRAQKAPAGAHDIGRRVRRKLMVVPGLNNPIVILSLIAVTLVLITFLGINVFSSKAHPVVVAAPQAPAVPQPPPQAPAKILFQDARDLCIDAKGNLFVIDSDAYTVSRISPSGHVTVLSGLARTPGVTDGDSGAARFSLLRGVATDNSGNLFVSDGARIRRISPTGSVTSLAGVTGSPGYADGIGKKARFDRPVGLSVDSADNVYVADTYLIRRVTPSGATSTIAGTPGHSGAADGRLGQGALLSDQGKGLAVDNAGTVYVADTLNCIIRKVSRDGTVSTLAGSAGRSGHADGNGKLARFFRPEGVAVDSSGTVYIADTFNHAIRKITLTGEVSTIAGSPGQPGDTDGLGSQARFNHPNGVAVGANGEIFVTDSGNHTIRRILSTGAVTTLTAHE